MHLMLPQLRYHKKPQLFISICKQGLNPQTLGGKMPATPAAAASSPSLRRGAISFLIDAAADLRLRPIVKYSALSLLADRLFPSLTRRHRHWLLRHPLREANLHLLALVSLWIGSKLHDSAPIGVRSLKSYSDQRIEGQCFTVWDFLEGEVVLLQVLDFEIGTSRIVYVFVEDLIVRFREIARNGERLSENVAMDVLDLLYEDERVAGMVLSGLSPVLVAGAVLVVSYVVSVERKGASEEFPVLAWVKFVTSCGEDEILGVVEGILRHIVSPCGVRKL